LGKFRNAAEADLGKAAEKAAKKVQPQGFNYAGVSDLKNFCQSLRGQVKNGLISRSITYVDGEPQNDYRPAINHSWFKGLKYFFQDQNSSPAGVQRIQRQYALFCLQRRERFYDKLENFVMKVWCPRPRQGFMSSGVSCK